MGLLPRPNGSHTCSLMNNRDTAGRVVSKNSQQGLRGATHDELRGQAAQLHNPMVRREVAKDRLDGNDHCNVIHLHSKALRLHNSCKALNGVVAAARHHLYTGQPLPAAARRPRRKARNEVCMLQISLADDPRRKGGVRPLAEIS
jgi:hypothetical protein